MTGDSKPMDLARWPYFDAEQREAVDKVLASGAVNYWTGTQGREFEKEYAEYCGVGYGVAVANGTLALELALRAVGVEPGDEVIVTSRSFMASASAVLMLGATPVFADVDLDSQNITAATIAPLISKKTRAIICVHLAGWPCDMDLITALAERHALKVVEDCAQAHGAIYKGRPVGSLGDVAAFSFCQDKIISTGGEGGMLITADKQVWKRAWSFKDHGKNWDKVYRDDQPPGFRWLHDDIGSNYRMTEMQAAIGRIQLTKLDKWRAARQVNAAMLDSAVASAAVIRTINKPPAIEHACYKHYLFIEPDALKGGWSRDRILSELQLVGIPCFSGSCSEMYLEKSMLDRGLNPVERLVNARKLGETSLMFLVHPTLSEDQVAWVARGIKRILCAASR